MDVMKPALINIGGRCYRKMPFEQRIEHRDSLEEDCYSENLTYDREDEACDAFGSIEKTEEGYQLCMQVPSLLYKFIIGKKGETKKKIEKETGTRIMIPRPGEKGDLVITGPQRSGVVGARSRVEVITESSRQKIPFTHFLSFPLYKATLEKKIDEFKVRVLKDCFECRGIDASIFQLPSKIHLTVGMLTLLSEEDVQNAGDLLFECYRELVSEYLQNSPVVVELKGVQYMNDDPAEVDVLYAKVATKDGSDRLQKLADGLVEKFVANGLMKKEYDRVKLHATVMKSKLRTDSEGQSGAKKIRTDLPPRFSKKMSFDARKIVALFEDFNFGEYHLDTIHLSTRGSYDADGHYACAVSVPLP
ncbi:activating signal cointegrator 1 complex subunit 1-like [Montipora foliosa]|uniref:activating signal cointegrator 1 complex subunit 1-like n=1 Tax=Montipora foliosa TaxID=591990 RepID=UPI0035F19550